MSFASLSLRTTEFTSGNACVEWRATSAVKPRLLSVAVHQLTATASSYGLGRPAAIGLIPVRASFQQGDTGDPASVIAGALSWGTSPTAPTVYLRRWNSDNAAGVSTIWTFPQGLLIPLSGSLVVHNITTTVACDVTAVVDC